MRKIYLIIILVVVYYFYINSDNITVAFMKPDIKVKYLDVLSQTEYNRKHICSDVHPSNDGPWAANADDWSCRGRKLASNYGCVTTVVSSTAQPCGGGDSY